MNIGILGSGNVGGTLGERWARLGHHVFFGSREPEKLGELVKRSGPTAHAAGLADAVRSAEVVAVTLPWGAAQGVLQSLDFHGKIVFDCMNPLLPDLSGLELGTTTSAGEKVAEWAHGAKVVKIFNSAGYNVMADPKFASANASMFYCGDDPQAKPAAHRLASELGFDPVDCGPLANSRFIEPLAVLWIWLALKGGEGRDIAFRLMHR